MTPNVKNLEKTLNARIRGQTEAITRVATAFKIGEYNLTEPGKPKGSLLFLGPTGVGKTETAKIIAHELFHRDALLRFDMSEFKHPDSIKNFIGDDTGNMGRLGNALIENPDGGIIFAEEMEKAHKDILLLFLQMLADARITCGKGRTFDLSKFYFIFTSNVGGKDLMASRFLTYTQMEQYSIIKLREEFPPEFANRFDHIILFNKLKSDVQFQIARDVIHKETEHLKQKGYIFNIFDNVYHFIVRHGIDCQRRLKKGTFLAV